MGAVTLSRIRPEGGPRSKNHPSISMDPPTTTHLPREAIPGGRNLTHPGNPPSAISVRDNSFPMGSSCLAMDLMPSDRIWILACLRPSL